MQLYTSLDLRLRTPCVLALGCFDGVHIGHRAVIDAARDLASKHGLPLAVFTFASPPRNFFSPNSTPLITPPEQKPQIFSDLGVDICVCVAPSREVFDMSPTVFINEVIVGKLCAKFVVCGYNYTFGKGGAGSPETLGAQLSHKGVGVCVLEKKTLDGKEISSSAIRECVSRGDLDTAAQLLGRPYSVSAKVVDGQHLARSLGFPTVNILPPHGQLLPPNGVYVSRVCFDGKEFFGITNVGVRPTVGTKILCVETHIINFEGNLYGKQIRVEFLRFVRPEQRFESVEQMAKQIHKDIDSAKKYVKNNR